MRQRDWDWGRYLRSIGRPEAPASPSDAGAAGLFGLLGYHALPVRLFYPHAPAIPLSLAETVDSLERLLVRSFQVKQSRQGLTNRYSIGGVEGYGLQFLYDLGPETSQVSRLAHAKAVLGALSPLQFVANVLTFAEDELAAFESTASANSLNQLSLETPQQWTLSWTTYPQVFQPATAQGLDVQYAAALTDAAEASRQFWPMIAEHGLAFLLLILAKVDAGGLANLQAKFAGVWNDDLAAASGSGRLYLIDLEWMQVLEPQQIHGATRFTPGSMVLLTQDAATKALTPVAVRLSTGNGNEFKVYGRLGKAGDATDSAWIYALLAARTTVTVWGIWLGHVYHCHMVTGAMQMTMYNNLSQTNPVYQILQPQSNFLIGFDNVLLLTWSAVAPPTSIASATQFLSLINTFAQGRVFFDDDPINTLKKNGIEQADFTVHQPWDQYPIVGQMLSIWAAARAYIEAVVTASYPTDASVAADGELQAWIADSGPAGAGNIAGLPELKSIEALVSVLTSLIYRVTIHGAARLNSTANPVLAFIANYPPCLQRSDFVPPSATIDVRTTFRYLPNTGTIGEMLTFLSIFAFSTPYEPFIPLEGIANPATLFYGPDVNSPANQALITFRETTLALLLKLDPGIPQVFQWPLNVET